jgi:hypothetical protein
MPWLRFGVEILPSSLLGVVLTLTGASAAEGRLKGTPLVAVLIGACICYVGSLAFREGRGWNLAFYAAFCLLAGAILGNLLGSQEGVSWMAAFLYSSAVIGLAASLSPWLGKWTGAMALSIQALFWIYVAGWVLIALLGLPRISMRLWAGGGMMVLFGLGSAWFYSLARQMRPPPEASYRSAFGLYVLAFNLAIAIKVLSLGMD